MDILKYISKNPELSEMYQTLEYSLILDTLTPEQIVYLANNPEALENWKQSVYEKVKEQIKTRLNKAFGISARSFGKTLEKSAIVNKIPEPEYNIHIPFNVKEVKIYDRKIHKL